MAGTVFGRSQTLTLSAVVAVFNLVVIFKVAGFNPTMEQIASVNIALAAVIAFIANTTSDAISAGVNAIQRMNVQASAGTTPGTDLANMVINGGKIAVTNTPANPKTTP